MKGMPLLHYRFVYFSTRGAGELCRLTLAVAGVEWQDIRYPLNLAGSGFRPGPEFHRDAAAGLFDSNMGRLPILQVIDPKQPERALVNIGQSHSICRFVASQHNLCGSNSLETAQIDSFYESCRDIRTEWYRAKRSEDGKTKWFGRNGDLHKHCLLLERAMKAGGSGSNESPWFLGSRDPTLADIALYHLLGTPAPNLQSGCVPSFMDGESDRIREAYEEYCPSLAKSIRAMGENEQVKTWETKRPDTFS